MHFLSFHTGPHNYKNRYFCSHTNFMVMCLLTRSVNSLYANVLASPSNLLLLLVSDNYSRAAAAANLLTHFQYSHTLNYFCIMSSSCLYHRKSGRLAQNTITICAGKLKGPLIKLCDCNRAFIDSHLVGAVNKGNLKLPSFTYLAHRKTPYGKKPPVFGC